jgi:hypothetical protein
MLDAVLREAIPVRDVDIQLPPVWPVKMNRAYDGALTYIHKVKGGRDIYFFANSTELPIDATVVLRGNRELEVWNPHSGERARAGAITLENPRGPSTTVRLVLPPVTSLFFVEGK